MKGVTCGAHEGYMKGVTCKRNLIPAVHTRGINKFGPRGAHETYMRGITCKRNFIPAVHTRGI